MIAIIDYKAGNNVSVKNVLNGLGFDCIVTSNPNEIQKAEHVIFPGVGEASTAMHFLKEHKLDQLICSLQQPFLGICLGMQLMCKHSEEGQTDCLGIFNSRVRKFPATEIVPHMGWNNLITTDHLLFKGLKPATDFYFIHSYYVESNDASIADCEYILPFCAAMQKDNFYAMQFHPEKSVEAGAIILKNFLTV